MRISIRSAEQFLISSGKLAVASLLLLLGVCVRAEAQTSHLTGRVTDPSGAVVRDADVRVVDVRTNEQYLLHTDQAGAFDAFTLQPSVYSVTVSRAGFKTLDRKGVNLALDTTTRLDLILALGESSDAVMVTADASQLQPDNAAMSTQITEKQYQNLTLVQNN